MFNYSSKTYFDQFTELENCGLGLACFSALLNFPIGLIAVIYATQGLAFIRVKDHNRASYFSYKSKIISIWAITVGIITLIGSVLCYLMHN